MSLALRCPPCPPSPSPPGLEPETAPGNHSNLVVFDEEPLPAGVALYARMALNALAG